MKLRTKASSALAVLIAASALAPSAARAQQASSAPVSAAAAVPAPPAAASQPITLTLRLPSVETNLRLGGMLQFWDQYAQHANSTFYVRNARVYVAGDVSPYVSFNIYEAFASPVGSTLLNAYIDVKPVDHLAFRVGQFVTPFGYDRMMAPQNLELANFHLTSKIFPGFASDLGWDDGVQAETKWSWVDARVAAINGEGLNVIKATDTTKDVTARVDFLPLQSTAAIAGFSYYHGNSHGASTVAPLFNPPMQLTWWGGHLINTFWDDRVQTQAEIITRSDRERLWTLQGSYKFHCWKDWQLVADWERFDPSSGHDTRRVTGAVNFWIDPRTRLSLDYYNDATGVGPSTSNGVAQLQVVF
jgi:hypothetical protein